MFDYCHIINGKCAFASKQTDVLYCGLAGRINVIELKREMKTKTSAPLTTPLCKCHNKKVLPSLKCSVTTKNCKFLLQYEIAFEGLKKCPREKLKRKKR